jgi:hypothetical protein
MTGRVRDSLGVGVEGGGGEASRGGGERWRTATTPDPPQGAAGGYAWRDGVPARARARTCA